MMIGAQAAANAPTTLIPISTGVDHSFGVNLPGFFIPIATLPFPVVVCYTHPTPITTPRQAHQPTKTKTNLNENLNLNEKDA
jgi:hypothetical protein